MGMSATRRRPAPNWDDAGRRGALSAPSTLTDHGAGPPGGYPLSWTLRLPYPLRNTLRRWRGVLGMVLGVGIALGIGMTLLGVSQASIELFSGDYRRSGADVYVVTNGGKPIPLLPGETPGTIEHARAVLTQIRALTGVNEAVGVMRWSLERERPGPRRSDEPTELIATMGVDGNPSLIPGMLLLREGRWIRRTDEMVIGTTLGRQKGLALGDSVRLNGRDFVVVGVGRLRGFGFEADSLAYVEHRALRQRSEVGDVVSMIAVDTTHSELARERIPELDPLAVYSANDLILQAREANQAGMAFYWIFIGLTLTIAGLFVSNMLGESVAERRLEFATLSAIGVPSRTILLSVAGEAILVSVLAGIVGIAISTALGALINSTLAPAYGIESLYVADAWLFLLVFALALGLGLAAGWLPARQAVRVEPVEVLREA
jgi:ABC-type lipoprotein release transport system permease subunit